MYINIISTSQVSLSFLNKTFLLVVFSLLLSCFPIFVSAQMGHEHHAVLNLVKAEDATHVASASGKWFDKTIWQSGRVPSRSAKVHIPKGISVTYQGASSERLSTIRVDGALTFAYWRNTKLVVDTIVVTGSGNLTIGNKKNPIKEGFKADILFADNGNINPNWDTELVSRGLISMGTVDIHGAKKDSFLKVAKDPMAGSRTLVFSKAPVGWKVGDKLVVTGTHKQGFDGREKWILNPDKHWRGTEDEVVTISSINGKRVTIKQALKYNHDTPASDLKAYVANLTRNVTFANEGGAKLPSHQRGHLMFMRNTVDVRYAAMDELGRTDKSFKSAGASTFSPIKYNSNVQGRYAIHLHRIGAKTRENPVQLIGNAVNGTPGWGMVQHSSNANFVDNVVYNAFGAAFVAESGDDIGNWLRNIAIKAQGRNWGVVAAQDTVSQRDAGRGGDGFWFSSRMVEASENVAANTTHGYSYISRNGVQADNESVSIPVTALDQPEIMRGGSWTHPTTPVLTEFRDNEAFGNQVGFQVVRSNPGQNHDLRSMMTRFTAWEVFRGVTARYSPHYTMIDLRVIGTDTPHSLGSNNPGGIVFERKSFDWVINGASIENMPVGVDTYGHDEGRASDNRVGIEFIDMQFHNVEQDYKGTTKAGHRYYDSAELVEDRLAVSYEPIPAIKLNANVHLNWLKIDSIGVVGRTWEFDHPLLNWKHATGNLLIKEGYYRFNNGKPFVLVDDLVADRATGEVQKLLIPVPLDFTKAQLSKYKDNGKLSFSAPAPIANSDRFRIAINTAKTLDVIANDEDPDGGRIWLDGILQPTHGELYLLEGKVRYEPDLDYSGDDAFSYWIRDEEGNITRGEVSVRVGGGAIAQAREINWADPGDFTTVLKKNIQPIAIQNREIIKKGQRSVKANPLANDHDANGDDLFLTAVYRSSGNASIDMRLDANGLATATTDNVNATGGAFFFYTINDGAKEGGDDDGLFYIFMGENNAKTAKGEAGFGPNLVKTAASYVPFLIKHKSGPLQHLYTYSESDLSRIEVSSDDYDIGSVRYYLDGKQVRLENEAPFSLNNKNLGSGEHLLRVVATSKKNGEGHLLFDSRTKFTVSADTSSGSPSSGSTVHMKKRNATGYAIDGGNGGANAQNVYLWTANSNNKNQSWIEINRGGGYFSYQKLNTNYCLDGNSGGANGQNVYLWTCRDGNHNQHWKKVSVASNSYRLEKRNAPGFSIDGGNGGAQRQNLYLWASNNNNKNQHWIFDSSANEKALTYLLQEDDSIWAWNGSAAFERFGPNQGKLVRIDVGDDAMPWGINSYGNIFSWDGNNWQRRGDNGQDIGVGGGQVYLTKNDDSIWRWNGKAFERFGSESGRLARLDVGEDGIAWGINDAGGVYSWGGSGWLKRGSGAQDIASGGGAVFLTKTDGTIWRWSGSRFERFGPDKSRLSRIDVGSDGVPWGINAAGDVYRWNGNAWSAVAKNGQDLGR
ncbi:Ig-like domain-containing protein [Agaribacterium sp. ZY112]|uniref:Ig-like domain-containing protein n=1 Tax=Agaribacterium sp. ZY112 TaxID=3233574 RepID=UPI0035263637